jgi:hypothetical protein
MNIIQTIYADKHTEKIYVDFNQDEQNTAEEEREPEELSNAHHSWSKELSLPIYHAEKVKPNSLSTFLIHRSLALPELPPKV